MSDQPEQSDKTEEPTERKLREARRKGDTPASKEVAGFAIIIAAALMTTLTAGPAAQTLGRELSALIDRAHAMRPGADVSETAAVFSALANVGLMVLAPILLAFAAAAVFAALAQNAAVFAPDRISPKLERISLPKGIQRLFSADSLMEFAKGLLKILAAGGAAAIVIYGELSRFGESAAVDIADAPAMLRDAVARLFIAVLVVMAVITILDVIWRRHRWIRQQRMTRQELKDEMRNSEGDPQIKARLDAIRRERARKRMIQAVPSASVVIMNPTHYAVALRYEAGETPAPICVAKGVDATALKIREAAEEAEVPVVEEPATARALYGGVEVDGVIPQELFLAVAEILTRIARVETRLRS